MEASHPLRESAAKPLMGGDACEGPPTSGSNSQAADPPMTGEEKGDVDSGDATSSQDLDCCLRARRATCALLVDVLQNGKQDRSDYSRVVICLSTEDEVATAL